MNNQLKNTAREAIGHFQTLPDDVLAAIVRGDLNAVALAARELQSRGLDQHGEWVGFSKAPSVHRRALSAQPELEHLQPF